MSQRIIFEFLYHPSQEPNKWTYLTELLRDAGGTLLSDPSGDPPYTLVAVLPDDPSAREIVARLRATDGVRRADLDAWRVAF